MNRLLKPIKWLIETIRMIMECKKFIDELEDEPIEIL